MTTAELKARATDCWCGPQLADIPLRVCWILFSIMDPPCQPHAVKTF
jgi:hypothetical protein